MAFGGAVLRFGQTGLRAIQLLASILILGIFSYFLAVLSDHHLPIHQWIKAVEGLSGAAALYLFFCVFLTLCLGGIALFAFIAVFLDICFVGCFIAIAVMTRGGAGSCSGNVNTALGSGPANSKAPGYGANGFGFGSNQNVTYAPNLHRACKLETACFAVAILNVFLFIITAVVQILLHRHHKREKRYGPSPANNYTSGSGRSPIWRRGFSRKSHNTRDAEMATARVPGRTSNETRLTGTTLRGTALADEPKYGQPGYGKMQSAGHY